MLRSLLVSALAVCSASASPVERNDCPDGSFSVQGSCYYFSPQSVNWFEAQEVGQHAATIAGKLREGSLKVKVTSQLLKFTSTPGVQI